MKVCVISTPVFRLPLRGYGGLEILAWQQAAGLAAKGHTVLLMAPDGSECPGVEIVPIGPERATDEKTAYSRYWPRLLECDAVIDHGWAKHSYQLKAEGRLKAPVLGVCHAPVNTMFGSWPPTYPGLPPVEKACPVCISHDQANHFQNLFGYPARVCHNGIDLDFYKPMDVPRSDRFLFLARFSQIKGGDLGIEACKRAGVGLDLVGDTSITNEPEYLERCKAMCDGERVRMVGPASRSECVWWFSQAYCLLHPNQRFREPLGLAPLESMACKSPVIAWRLGAMVETIKQGETGFLVDSLDEMVRLIREDAVGSLDREHCREWASQFSVRKMVDRMEELCQEAVERSW